MQTCSISSVTDGDKITVKAKSKTKKRKQSPAEPDSSMDLQLAGSSQTQIKPFKVQKRKAWSQEEQSAVTRQLSHCVEMRRVPRKDEIIKAMQVESVLQNRTWQNIKDFVYHRIKISK